MEMPKAGGKTLKYEESLPSLPVPPLKLTCKKYLESVKPCVSSEEFLRTKAKVEEFCNGVGPILQEELERRALVTKNWLEKWWEEYAYMKPRYPIAPFVNICGPLHTYEDIWPSKDDTQITRTAITIHFLMKEWKLLYSQERNVDMKGDIPLSMSQYYRLLSFCRIPGRTIDTYVEAFKPAPAPTADYITVITRGRIYKCVVLNANLDPIGVAEMKKQLHCIICDANQKPLGPGLGSLTSENRPVWAEAREYLLSRDPSHNGMIEVIQNSLITVALEDTSPSSIDEFSSLLIGGNCHNRWFEKSFQLISFKNGLLGVNIDHLAYDGIPEIITVVRAINNIKKYWKFYGHENVTERICDNVPRPSELEFQIDHRLHEYIEAATKHFSILCSNIARMALEFRHFGKKKIQRFRLHPDTFVQMAVQLADYRLHKRVSPTYETATTRTFYHGRTDTVRTLTREVQNWCREMEKPQDTAANKAKLLRIACLKHNELMMEAQNGLGIDRHLLGLKILAEESGLPTPGIYTDAAWVKSGGDGNFTLSTSFLGYFPVSGYCPPMVEDGYGLFYSIQNERFARVLTRQRKMLRFGTIWLKWRRAFRDKRKCYEPRSEDNYQEPVKWISDEKRVYMDYY